MGELYFEDFHIGQEFKTATYEMTTDEIINFAKQFDPQFFHTDPEAAKQSLFGGLAASGWHTASISMKLQIESEMKVAGGMIGTGIELNWPNPTRAGDILQVFAQVIEILDTHPNRGIIIIKSETRNQKGVVLMMQTAKVLVFKRPK